MRNTPLLSLKLDNPSNNKLFKIDINVTCVPSFFAGKKPNLIYFHCIQVIIIRHELKRAVAKDLVGKGRAIQPTCTPPNLKITLPQLLEKNNMYKVACGQSGSKSLILFL